MFVQEPEGIHGVDLVHTVEPFYCRPVRDAQKGVESPDLGVFVRGPFVEGDAVPVALEGRLFSAPEAKLLGLVDEVTSAAQLMSRAVERAGAFSGGTREAVATIKRSLRRPALEAMEQQSAEELEG